VRLPGERRHLESRRAENEGVDVPQELVAKLQGYAERAGE
jgi:LDH2 family malate/lactate/ureidoglycolate dehydrogenase